jgi:hypothetical protein
MDLKNDLYSDKLKPMTFKKYVVLMTVCLLTACGNRNVIELDVNVPGLSNATFIVKDDAGKSVFGANIVNGKCYIKSPLEVEGFYTFNILIDGKKSEHVPYEIFLTPGKYTITADEHSLWKYPTVVSKSKRQQEVSDFNTMINNAGKATNAEISEINKELKAKGDGMNTYAYNATYRKLSAAQNKRKQAGLIALQNFVKANPHSEFAAHFMDQLGYQDDPAEYYELYQHMGDLAKNSLEGKLIGERLSGLVKLAPRKPAPAINGKTFDGKNFAQITTGKKIFLIDFWRAGNTISRKNHDDIKSLYSEFKDKGLQIISVSLDSKPLWWITAVKDDKLPWPQMADLKGNDSPNTLKWGITTIPTYDLISGRSSR